MSKRNLSILFWCVTFISLPILQNTARAQQLPVRDLMEDYLDLLKTSGEIPLGHSSAPDYDDFSQYADTLSGHPWMNRPDPVLSGTSSSRFTFLPYDLDLRNYWQSLEPLNENDGAVWQGRGFTNSFSTGLFMRYSLISASIRPSVIYNQNRHFELSPYTPASGRSEYAYPLGNIDWPQRFGDDSFWTFALQNSFLRADYYGWSTGISNESMWWSPARQNSLLMSNSAPGFPHFFIGTSEPKDIWIGHLETNLFWGKLMESDYFDGNPDNNERYITGGRIVFTPDPVPGLHIGINRIYYEIIPTDGIPVGDLLKVFEAFTKINLSSSSNPGGNDRADQLLSLFGSWTFPESGLKIYGEWARTDHSWNWRDFITEPEHSRGYTLGLLKVFDLPDRRMLSVNAELTQLEASKTGVFRGYPTFYVHSRARQGYTHLGQMLGASIGPGSSSQYLGAALYFDQGKIELWTQRVAINNDFLYRSPNTVEAQNTATDRLYWLHNIEMSIGTSLTYFYKQFEASLGLRLRKEFNDDYIYEKDQVHAGLEFSIRYRLSELR